MQIGIIDSGVGGLSFLRMLEAKYPFFNYLLLMDKAYFPYGLKEQDELKKRGIYLVEYLKRRCDLVIIACNTLSIILKDYDDEKVLNIAKQTKAYLKNSKYKKIGLLASKKTIESKYYQDYILWSYDATKEIDDIEHKKGLCLDKICFPDIDALLLGCTHFIEKKEAFKSLGIPLISQDEIITFPKGRVIIQSSQLE